MPTIRQNERFRSDTGVRDGAESVFRVFFLIHDVASSFNGIERVSVEGEREVRKVNDDRTNLEERGLCGTSGPV